jgi:hypothetical protein
MKKHFTRQRTTSVKSIPGWPFWFFHPSFCPDFSVFSAFLCDLMFNAGLAVSLPFPIFPIAVFDTARP